MNHAVASLAVTLDGYVCRPDGSVDYLEKYNHEENPFDEFIETIGALILGRTSYEQAVGWGWTWGHLPTMVLTTRTNLPVPDGADVRFHAGPTGDAIREFAEATPDRLWVFGGGQVVTEGLRAGAVDSLDITIMPEAIGTGLPLFTAPYDGRMDLVETQRFSWGGLRVVYRTSDRT